MEFTTDGRAIYGEGHGEHGHLAAFIHRSGGGMSTPVTWGYSASSQGQTTPWATEDGYRFKTKAEAVAAAKTFLAEHPVVPEEARA